MSTIADAEIFLSHATVLARAKNTSVTGVEAAQMGDATTQGRLFE